MDPARWNSGGVQAQGGTEYCTTCINGNPCIFQNLNFPPKKNIPSLSNQFSTHSNFHHKFSSLLLIKTLKLDYQKCFSFSPIFSFSLFFHLKLTHHKFIQTFLFLLFFLTQSTLNYLIIFQSHFIFHFNFPPLEKHD
jgi:hypothetical protein